MRIINHGNVPRKVRRFICRNCGCIFEAEKGEYLVRFDRNEEYYEANCPDCHNAVHSYGAVPH